jgi:transaldolase
LGRLDDIGEDGVSLLNDICRIYELYDLDCQIIAASIRSPFHVLESARVGADVVTVPYAVLLKLFEHPLTTAGIEKFLADWKKK